MRNFCLQKCLVKHFFEDFFNLYHYFIPYKESKTGNILQRRSCLTFSPNIYGDLISHYLAIRLSTISHDSRIMVPLTSLKKE